MATINAAVDSMPDVGMVYSDQQTNAAISCNRDKLEKACFYIRMMLADNLRSLDHITAAYECANK